MYKAFSVIYPKYTNDVDTMNLAWFVEPISMGHMLKFPNQTGPVPDKCFSFANSADPDEMLLTAAFYRVFTVRYRTRIGVSSIQRKLVNPSVDALRPSQYFCHSVEPVLSRG